MFHLRVPLLVIVCLPGLCFGQQDLTTLPGSQPLTWEGPIWERMVDGIDRFLLSELDRSIELREQHWQRDFSSNAAYAKSVEPNRKRLADRLGVQDQRVGFEDLQLAASLSRPALLASSDGYEVLAVRWPVLRDIHGEGLLLRPTGDRKIQAAVVAIPDADQTPEMLCGLVAGVARESQFARRLAEAGCLVIVPALIDRELKPRGSRATLTSREYLHRSAYELGRHIAGYEIQKTLACVDWFAARKLGEAPKIGLMGWGEGGMIALYAAALDPRIEAACVSGYFDSRQTIWNQPLDRNVFGLLEQFGDAEVASLVAPRKLVIEACAGPELQLPSQGGAPAILNTPELDVVRREVARARRLIRELPAGDTIELVESRGGRGPCGSQPAVNALLSALGADLVPNSTGKELVNSARLPDAAARQVRLQNEIDVHNQWLLRESGYVRQAFMNIGLTREDNEQNQLDTSSLAAYEASIERFREHFKHEVIGHLDIPLLPFNVRSRKAYDEPKWTGYEVVLDVFDDVIAYGVLCLPKGIQAGQRRPVVVCQHGLEGQPQDTIAGDHRAYHDFAAKLAERGFITFAPQNIYIGRDRFRTLQRKAYPLKKTLFSIMVPQHQQIVNWLKSLPEVDAQRIAFYGLSYGGKSAMRIPPLVPDYCLSICSADFNEWVWKNASTRSRYSYVWTKEYEIFEFDLGSTFNYAEMAALIAPRPFMVERGHFDGVSSDQAVAYEFGKVRHLYAARLGIPERCEIEFFVGPHTINGQGTFEFLHKHLDWPRP